MAVSPVTAAPFIIVKPKILLGNITTGVTIECAANQVDASPEQDENTYETFCGTYTTYKPEKWVITVTALQSFGAAGLWTLVRPLVGTVTAFELLPDTSVARSVSNPAMVGNALVKAFPFLTSPVGEPSEFELVLAVQGVPTFPIT
jgi:hypothetical protein